MCRLADVPTISTIVHTSCSPSGNGLVGCPPGGTGTLIINGQYFYGSVSVNVGCSATPAVNGAYNQLTCTLVAGTGGSTTSNLVVTANGGPSVGAGFTIGYGNTNAFICCFVLVSI